MAQCQSKMVSTNKAKRHSKTDEIVFHRTPNNKEAQIDENSDDKLRSIVLGIYHLVAAVVCDISIRHNDNHAVNKIFYTLYFIHVGYEIASLILVVLKPTTSPTDLMHLMSSSFVMATLGIFLVVTGCVINEPSKAIMLSLMLGDACMYLTNVYINTLLVDWEEKIQEVLRLQIFDTMFWMYCRFYVIPSSFELLFQTMEITSSGRIYAVVTMLFLNTFSTMFTILNIAILVTIRIPNTITLVRRCFSAYLACITCRIKERLILLRQGILDVLDDYGLFQEYQQHFELSVQPSPKLRRISSCCKVDKDCNEELIHHDYAVKIARRSVQVY